MKITRHENKRGFTLLELLIVIAILGILVTMVVGNFMTSIKRGRDSKRKQEINQVGKALELYYSDFGRYPTASSGIIHGCGANGNTDNCAWGTIFSATVNSNTVTYMVQLPKDTPASKDYFYDSDASGTYYQIYALLENLQDPDIVNGNQYYDGTDCGGGFHCNYGIASVNELPTTNHSPTATP